MLCQPIVKEASTRDADTEPESAGTALALGPVTHSWAVYSLTSYFVRAHVGFPEDKQAPVHTLQGFSGRCLTRQTRCVGHCELTAPCVLWGDCILQQRVLHPLSSQQTPVPRALQQGVCAEATDTSCQGKEESVESKDLATHPKFWLQTPHTCSSEGHGPVGHSPGSWIPHSLSVVPLFLQKDHDPKLLLCRTRYSLCVSSPFPHTLPPSVTRVPAPRGLYNPWGFPYGPVRQCIPMPCSALQGEAV